jgi:hypothetical protein
VGATIATERVQPAAFVSERAKRANAESCGDNSSIMPVESVLTKTVKRLVGRIVILLKAGESPLSRIAPDG